MTRSSLENACGHTIFDSIAIGVQNAYTEGIVGAMLIMMKREKGFSLGGLKGSNPSVQKVGTSADGN
jgi:hypothetical protein